MHAFFLTSYHGSMNRYQSNRRRRATPVKSPPTSCCIGQLYHVLLRTANLLSGVLVHWSFTTYPVVAPAIQHIFMERTAKSCWCWCWCSYMLQWKKANANKLIAWDFNMKRKLNIWPAFISVAKGNMWRLKVTKISESWQKCSWSQFNHAYTISNQVLQNFLHVNIQFGCGKM